MNMTITKEAASWFKEELDIHEGDEVQLFVRYGGDANFQRGFSLGVAVKPREEPGIEKKVDGIVFYIEKKDLWYLDGEDFEIMYDSEKEEIAFLHGKAD
ncbi:HesB/YadR/YfhF family protein [Salisediminibacterium beveridgei]|uniref:Core domain-containing protein n=1 Tax=Salisediminibacterium beveridgei TaxID=632773 RepID=A0A1D7QWK7_9BACI|nr:HesB/YadR/YfhF family protein [Salisediminibacterium beveridgei]AOM83390.1 hypothetical protein BBEV_2030 [Salisediminibacterium beveridgei]